MIDIGYLAAFLGGLLALVSPCSALLLPAFFAYAFGTTARLLSRTLLFYAGLCTTLVPLGAAGSLAGRLFYGHRDLLVTIGGWTVIALGIAQVLGIGFASRRMQEKAAGIRPGSAGSVYALGTVYGLAGFCAGPVLGGVLTVSAMGGNPVYGGALLAVYALGMAFPMFLLALMWDRFRLGGRRWLRGRGFHLGPLHLHTNSLLSGVFFVLLGVIFLLFDGTSALPGLMGVDAEYAAEQWVGRISAGIPDIAVVLLAMAVIVAVILVVRFRGSAPTRAGTSEATEQAVSPRTRPRPPSGSG
ncbi:cytochrome C biogenesis protein CcdA [Sphaerimonospora thailandensis]|uniref:Cytochrome C biogenesis protein CcdA n=1 Tax=Sphaerimonospora thailandensis TaxID=795644 RepID=A0A8J3R522_9ACTN|nr:cytochrome c biogenesis CcdA family protein [Sphaerimonospora thailandensis]GIH68590.1 cytochrome C biogenesis protein CcdA [Sphaerimonospora thailandensis]